MKCLICDRPLKHAKQSECECGESLTFWTAQLTSSQTLRQRGLAQAAKGKYVGACVSFLEAALANPADQQNLIDAAKALAHGGYHAEGRQLLENADARYKEPKAAVLQVIQKLEQEAKRPVQRALAPVPAPPPAPAAVSDNHQPPPPPDVPPAPPTMPLLALPIMKRKKKWLKAALAWVTVDHFPAIWQTVLGMENSWPRDWQGLEPWATAAAREAAKTNEGAPLEEAVFHYMVGLAHVQIGQRDAALAAFERCLQLQPPVLNAAAYFLFLHLESASSAQKALARLKNDYDKGERAQCCGALLDRLERRGDKDKAALVRQLEV